MKGFFRARAWARALCLALALGMCFPFSLPAKEKKAAPAAEAEAEYPPLVIGPGDLLSIYVYDEKDLPTEYLVDATGAIVFPLVGEARLGGMSQNQASAELTKRLGAVMKSPQVTVLVKESNSYNIAVIGQVARPGKYIVRGRPTLVSVLSEAGGPLDNADYGGAFLIRGREISSLDLNKYLRDTGNRDPQPMLFPGDTILVPKTPWPTIGEWGIIASIITSGALLYATIKK